MENSTDSTDEALCAVVDIPDEVHQVMSVILDELDRMEGPSQAPGKNTCFCE